MRKFKAVAGLFIVCLAGAASFGIYRNYFKTSAAANAPKPQGCCASEPAVLRRMIGTYYTTEDNLKSTLILNNKGPNQILVNPILYAQNGQSYQAAGVAVDGQNSKEVDLNMIAASAGPDFRSGSFEFTYMGRLLEVGAGLTIIEDRSSRIFHEQLGEPGMKFGNRLEAVYSIPFASAKVRVILTNTTAQPLFINGSIQTALKPHQSQVVNLPVKDTSPGAVSLNHNSAVGALLAMIHVWDADKGFSQSVSFSDPSKNRVNQLHGAGLRLGNINGDTLSPVITVRNIGSAATIVNAVVPYAKKDGSGKIALPQLSLEPGEIKLMDTSNPQLKRTEITTAGLEIAYEGKPGDVIASVQSISKSGNHVFELPMQDPQVGLASTGGYPFFIKESASTVVFIKNTTNESQRFILGIIFPGGKWGSNLKTLEPGQTYELDVRKVRDSQMKGSEGNTMPSDVSVGHVSWSIYGPEEKGLIGRAQTIDLARGQSSTYECRCVCGITFGEARLLPGTVSGFIGDTQQFYAEERDRDCFGNFTHWFGVNPQYVGGGFSSQNPNVATIDLNGLGTAVGEGSTNINANWIAYQRFNSGQFTCTVLAVAALCSAFCSVADVQITPHQGCTDGSTANFAVTVTGGTASSYQWTWSAPGGVGNSPDIRFSDAAGANTSTNCHWFAKPNQECATTPPPPSPSHPYYNATYDLECKVTFSDGKSKTKKTKLTVGAFWDRPGVVGCCTFDGGPGADFDTQRNVWYITGPGTLRRGDPVMTITVPPLSQFYDKTLIHENKHIEQYNSGMLSDLFRVSTFMARIQSFTDPTYSGLIAKVNAEATTWLAGQRDIRESRRSAAEIEAYNISDQIDPKYAYQRCGRTSFPPVN